MFTQWLIDLIFPAHCLGCSTVSSHLCQRCMSHMRPRPHQECIACKHPSKDGTPCLRCGSQTVVDKLLIAGRSDDALLMRAIHSLKYEYLTGLAQPLAHWLVDTLALRQAGRGAFTANPLVAPVPLHPRRQRERGFNQSELLAQHIAARVAMPYATNLVERTRYTPSQVKTHSRSERLENIKGAFWCPQPELVADRDIVLIDDVCTTGATLDACAYALKENGARSVSAIVLTRG